MRRCTQTAWPEERPCSSAFFSMASNNDGLMQDPYAASGSSLPPPPIPSGNSSAAADDLFLLPKEPVPQPDFLFAENYDESYRRSWGERLTYHVGCAYSIGAPCRVGITRISVPLRLCSLYFLRPRPRRTGIWWHAWPPARNGGLQGRAATHSDECGSQSNGPAWSGLGQLAWLHWYAAA